MGKMKGNRERMTTSSSNGAYYIGTDSLEDLKGQFGDRSSWERSIYVVPMCSYHLMDTQSIV